MKIRAWGDLIDLVVKQELLRVSMRIVLIAFFLWRRYRIWDQMDVGDTQPRKNNVCTLPNIIPRKYDDPALVAQQELSKSCMAKLSQSPRLPTSQILFKAAHLCCTMACHAAPTRITKAKLNCENSPDSVRD
jgi:hypothetical protein